jgi:predicted DsbA family dithiol-disulfide isomerase
VATVEVVCVTDPADPWSWAAEPAVRRLEVEFAAEVAITYVMAGMAREFRAPAPTARAVLDAAAAGGMPADARPWLGGGPSSSYPACLAVKAAAEQGMAGPVLRALREGFMVDGRAQDSPGRLLEAVRGVAGLDLARFEVDLSSNAILEAFAADLDLARGSAPRDGVRPLPVWRVRAAGRDERLPAGEIGVAALRDAVVASGAVPAAGGLPGPEEVVRRFGRVATAEVAAACDLPGARAPAELWRLALEWRVRPEPVLGGELWRPGG